MDVAYLDNFGLFELYLEKTCIARCMRSCIRHGRPPYLHPHETQSGPTNLVLKDFLGALVDRLKPSTSPVSMIDGLMTPDILESKLWGGIELCFTMRDGREHRPHAEV